MISETVDKYLTEGGKIEATLKGENYVVTKVNPAAASYHSLFKVGEQIPKSMFMHMVKRYNLIADLKGK